MKKFINISVSPRLFKNALIIFIPIISVLATLIAVFLYITHSSELEATQEKELHSVALQQRNVDADIKQAASDLAILSHSNNLSRLWDDKGNPDPLILAELKASFLNFTIRRKLYDQIRLLDDSGMEIARVNYARGQPFIVPLEKLQNKKGRYYFDDAFILNKGEVFISPLDLNIEQGQIEQPLKPMIRLATPVYDHNEIKRGVLLLNYLGSKLIRHFTRISNLNDQSQAMILNRSGYWIKSPDSKNEWGFMYKDRKELTFANAFPNEWRRIQTEEDGQFETPEGLFTLATVYPLLTGQHTSSGSGEAYAPSKEKLKPQHYYWKIISHIPSSVLSAKHNKRCIYALVALLLLSVILLGGSWLVADAAAKRNQAENNLRLAYKQSEQLVKDRTKELRLSERKYRKIFDHSFNGIVQSALDGEMLTANDALAKMYGYPSAEALLEEMTDIANQLYVNAEDRDQLLKQLHAKGRVTEFQTQHRCRDGKVIDVSINVHFVSDPETGEQFIEGIVEDVTEKNQFIKAIKLSEQKYFRAFYNSPVLVVLSSRDEGRYIEVNETFLTTMGYTHEEVIGRNSVEINSWVDPNDRKTILYHIKNYGFIRNFEAQRLTKSGERLTVLYSAEVLDISGDPCLLSVSQDISARKQAEEELRLNENDLRITLDSIGDAVISTDAKCMITRMNPVAERLTAWSITDAMGRPLQEVFHIINSQTRMPASNPAKKVLEKGKIVGLANHTVLISKEGVEYQIADSGAPIRDNDGQIAGVVLVFRDVTESYAQAKQIQDNERILKNINANIPGVVYQLIATLEHEYTVSFVSEKVFDYFGIDGSTEQVFEKFVAGIPDEEKEGFLATMNGAVDHLRPWYYEGRYIKPSGELIWFSGNSTPIKEGDQVVFYGVLTDISEIKQWQQTVSASERRYQDLFNQSPVMCTITRDRKGEPYIQDVNDTFIEVLGYSRQQVINTSMEKYYTEESTRELMGPDGYQRILNGEAVIEERTLVALDGRLVHTLMHSMPQNDEDGRIIGSQAMYLDITSRKKAEKQAKKLKSALTQYHKMEAMGTLAGGIAHDFNNILSALIGYTQLALLETGEGTSLHNYLDKIFTASMRARDLVQQILTFSRQNERELKLLQIEPLIKEALILLRSSLPSTIEISQRIDPDLDSVEADSTQIHQIIMNLCTNAAHAMDDDGGQLTICLSEVNLLEQDIDLHPGLKSGTYIKLSVEDSGQGIPEEYLDKIFDPYFTTKEQGGGTGLGLSVVHGIVQSFGGAIHAYSEVGRGTKFNVYFPAVQYDELIETQSDVVLPTGSERILFVDDEPILVELGQQTLETLGYQVTACTGSLGALEIFLKAPHDVDLVISDMTMPKMTGDKMAAKILGIRPELPIILCTGFSKKISPKKAAEIGVKKVMTKPIVVEELAHIIRDILDGVEK